MTEEPEDDDLQPYDGPCAVCGETVLGTRYLALGVFAAVSEEGDAMHFTPDEAPATYPRWTDVSMASCVHVECFGNYFDGVMVDLAARRRHEMPPEDEEEFGWPV